MSQSLDTSLPRCGGGRRVTLSPGIYVAARRLAMGFPGFLGAHQFVFGIPANSRFPRQQTLAGYQVIVMGAYNVDGRLQAAVNGASDIAALRQYLYGSITLDVARVSYAGTGNSISMFTMSGYPDCRDGVSHSPCNENLPGPRMRSTASSTATWDCGSL